MTIIVTVKNTDANHSVAVQYQNPDQPSEGLWDEDLAYQLIGPGQSKDFTIWALQHLHLKEA